MTILDSSLGSHDEHHGASLRKQIKKMEVSQHSKYFCKFCGKVGHPRHSQCTSLRFLTHIWLNCSVGAFMLINIITGSAPTAYEMQQKLRTKILLFLVTWDFDSISMYLCKPHHLELAKSVRSNDSLWLPFMMCRWWSDTLCVTLTRSWLHSMMELMFYCGVFPAISYICNGLFVMYYSGCVFELCFCCQNPTVGTVIDWESMALSQVVL